VEEEIHGGFQSNSRKGETAEEPGVVRCGCGCKCTCIFGEALYNEGIGSRMSPIGIV